MPLILILSRISQISSVIESLNSHNSAFNEENYSRKKLEEEVVCLIFVSGVSLPFSNSGDSGKVSLSVVSGVLKAFNICEVSGVLKAFSICDVSSKV